MLISTLFYKLHLDRSLPSTLLDLIADSYLDLLKQLNVDVSTSSDAKQVLLAIIRWPGARACPSPSVE